MSLIVSTKKPVGAYKILIESCKKHSENLTKKKMKLIVFEKDKISLKFIFYLLKNTINLSIFNDADYIKLKYKEFEIGRHAYSRTLRDTQSYLNNYYKFLYKVKYLIEASRIIEKSIKLSKLSDAVYVDHGVYLNGLVIQVFARYGKIIYQNVYPRGLSYKDLRKRKINKPFTYEEILKLKKNEIILNKKKRDISYRKIKNIINNPENIPWIKGTIFKKFENINLNNFTHIVYAHSFADGQLVWGLDQFNNMRDWLIFTLINLDKNQNKILVKAHPNFTLRGYFNEACRLDKKIFLQIKKKFRNSKNIFFEVNPKKNSDLLKEINSHAILISHHGSAILEGSFFKFKSICSEATFWEKKLKISNSWKNKDEYLKLLNNSWARLNNTNFDDLLTVSYLLYCNEFGHYGKKFWHQIISRVCKIGRNKLDKNIENSIKKIKNSDKLTTILSQNIQKI